MNTHYSWRRRLLSPSGLSFKPTIRPLWQAWWRVAAYWHVASPSTSLLLFLMCVNLTVHTVTYIHGGLSNWVLLSSVDTNIWCGNRVALLDIFMSYLCAVQSVFPQRMLRFRNWWITDCDNILCREFTASTVLPSVRCSCWWSCAALDRTVWTLSAAACGKKKGIVPDLAHRCHWDFFLYLLLLYHQSHYSL